MINKIKRFFTQNLWLKFLAIIFAIAIWFIVMNIEDYNISKTINDIPVSMLNGNTILDNGMVYDITGGETITITVSGPRSVVENLTASDFYASADLSHLSVTNSTTISVVPKNSISLRDQKLMTITAEETYVTLSIENEIEKTIPVKVVTTGTVLSGYALGNASPTPNMVTVKGPESVLEDIVEARAVVNVTARGEDISEDVVLGCMDSYGNAINKDNISLSDNTVNVSIPLYKTKSVPVNITTTGVPGADYSVKDIMYEPTSVTVAADDATLATVTSIEVNNISVSEATENIEANVDIADYLPENVVVADGADQIAVSVEIEGLSSKESVLQSSDIRITDKSSEYDYEITSPVSLKVKVSGFEDDVADFSVVNLNPRVSVKDLEIGTHEIEVQFDSSDSIAINDSYLVLVEISEKDDNDNEPD